MFETVLFLDSAGQPCQNFTTYFNENIVLDPKKKYKIALINAFLWHSWFNVTENNNIFVYKKAGRTFMITIPPGAYNIPDLNNAIKQFSNTEGVTIEPNYNTLRCKITLAAGYEIDFTHERSLRHLLGFKSRLVTESGDGDLSVDITSVHSLLIRCSLVTGSFINGTSSDVLYSFTPNTPPGTLLHMAPTQPIYLPVSQNNTITAITINITDQSGNMVDFRGERGAFFLSLKEV